LEIGRGGRIALLFFAGTAAAAAHGSCPITPYERNLDFRVVQKGRAVELRRHSTPDSAPPLCVLQLACRLPDAKPVTVSYSMRRDSILMGDISAMHFAYRDGTQQSCRVTEIEVPQ
jgi:hypothetical protein